MIWYYVTYNTSKLDEVTRHRVYSYNVNDIYGIRRLTTPLSEDTIHHMHILIYRLESKCRYSGLLYDKLRCLLSYIYRNKSDITFVTLQTYDTLNFSTHRFDTKIMYPEIYSNKFIYKDISPMIKKVHFINY